MATFKDYLDKMGYGWNDFDRPHEMEGLIEQYANEIKSQETPPVEVELGYMIDVWIQHYGYLNLDTNEQEIIDFYNRITS